MYIVTGGAGLIGSAVVWKLNQRGAQDILVVDHLGVSDKWRNLVPLRFSDYMEKDDFRRKILSGEFNGCRIDAVFHLGACSSTTQQDASYLIGNNFQYTKDLAAFAAARGISFVYASSCATYGDGSCGYRDDENDLERLRPLNMYGYSKHLFDLWAKRQGLLSRLTGCKFSNIYGPNELHKGEMRSVALRCFEQITSAGRVQLFRSYRSEYGDGEQMRDFLYVKDAADMMLFLYDMKATGLYNIGSGRAETWNKLAAAAFNALGLPTDIQYIDMPEPLRVRYQYYTKTDMTKLRALGYDREPTPLNEAVADYIHNYLVPHRFLGDGD